MLVHRFKRGRPCGRVVLQAIDLFEHATATREPTGGDAGGRRDVAYAEFLDVGVGVNLEGVVFLAEVTGCPTAVGPIHVISQLNERRHSRLEPLLMADHRSERRIDQRRIDLSARQDVLVGHAVAGVLRIPAAQQRKTA